MATKKTNPPEAAATEIDSTVADTLTANQNAVASIQAAHSSDRDLVNQLLGQVQAVDAIKQISQTLGVSKLAYVKEHKLYKAIAGQRTPNGLELKGTWEEFCNLLGYSDEKVNIDIANLKAFGEEALESMNKIGIGYRDMRQYRRLPEDEKTALIEAAKTGDKDVFLDLAEEIISRHTATQASMQESIDELETNHQTQGEILAQVKEENLDLKMEIKKLKPGTKQWDAVIGELKEEITNHQSIFDEVLAHHMESVDAIDSWITQHVTSQKDYDPEAPVVIPKQAVTALLHLEDCINRSAHLIAAARNHLQNEYGAELADARRDLLTEDE